MHEAAFWDRSTFATLTYDEAHVPTDGSLDRDEFTKFWKRLRKSLGARKLRYYGCGEYGEKYGRPHYHAIIFGVGIAEKALVQAAWSKDGVPLGLVHLGTVTKASVRYTADYVGKAVGEKRGKAAYDVLTGEFYLGRAVPFAVMSQGLGREYVDAHGFTFLGHGVTLNGAQVPCPRYYRSRLTKEVQVQDDLWVSVGFRDPVLTEAQAEMALRLFFNQRGEREQVDRNLRARSGLRAKGFM